ncbi:MAG: Tad domain-containing protein, partial [Planctomycetota bacterium]|nr:Tad domain-containing protein [Planctomycetota bacterium]
MHPIQPSPTPLATLPASRYRGASPNGSVLGVLAVALPIMTMLAAFCINTAQIQLARTELMVATDAAAKAGGRAFSELQSTEAAKDAAAVTAARNLVQGQPLILQSQNSANEIEFGRTEQVAGESGRYAFIKVPTEQVEQEIQLANAVRVTGRRDQNSQSGEADFFLPNLLS